MSNMLDYLQWRGDLTLEQSPFNAVDGLILSQLSYLLWEKALGPAEQKPLSALAAALEGQAYTRGVTAENNEKLLPLSAQSRRFGDAVLCGYVHEYDEVTDKQFAAVTFLLPGIQIPFVAFRGTDGTLVGWKEDLNMAFTKPVPAQLRAAEYLAEAARRYDGPLLVGGHSKGGNLAMYAAAAVPAEVQERLLAVYANDGPGLSAPMFASDGYRRIEPKLHSYVPQSSIVGMLLMHPEHYTVVQSDANSIMQHDPYSWQVLGADFVTADGLEKDSLYFEGVIKSWLDSIDDDQRRSFIDTLFDILGAAGARSLKELWPQLLHNPQAVAAAIRDVEPATRQKVMESLRALASAAIHYERDQLPANRPELPPQEQL